MEKHPSDARLREFASIFAGLIEGARAQRQPEPCNLRNAFMALADSMPCIVWTAEPDGDVTFFNRHYYEILGASSADWRAIIHPEDKANTEAAWAHAVTTGVPYCNTARFRDATGTWRVMQSNARPVMDARHRILYWLGSSTVIGKAAMLMLVA